MWVETDIEKCLNKKITDLSGSVLHINSYVSYYTNVKNYYIKEIYSNISRIEPNLTDHGELHIQNVLQNAYDLIKKSDNSLSGVELYILCMCILIHDIGNLSGRVGHEEKLREYFNFSIFSTLDKQHITLISQIAKSHGGQDCDAIARLTIATLDGQAVRTQKIAAILRFADELAEGKQRTSLVMLEKSFIKDDSRLYHEYASILSRPTILANLIVLNYEIYLDVHLHHLKQLLSFIHNRVNKLYKELLYCGYYCEDVANIKKVSVTISLYEDQNQFEPLGIQNQLLKFELSGQNAHCSQNIDFESNYIEIMQYINKLAK